MMGFGSGLGFGLGGWLSMLGGILLMIGVVVLIVWALGRTVQPDQGAQPTAPRPAAQNALEVLRLRFARGEMTADEFLAAKQILENER